MRLGELPARLADLVGGGEEAGLVPRRQVQPAPDPQHLADLGHGGGFEDGVELAVGSLDAPLHRLRVLPPSGRLGHPTDAVLVAQEPAQHEHHPLPLGRGRPVLPVVRPLRLDEVVLDLADPAHQVERAAPGDVAALVDELLVRDRVALEAVGGDAVEVDVRAEHAALDAGLDPLGPVHVRLQAPPHLDGRPLRAVVVVDGDPVAGGAVAALARDARDGLHALPLPDGGVVAAEAEAGALGRVEVEVVQDLLRPVAAVELVEAGGVGGLGPDVVLERVALAAGRLRVPVIEDDLLRVDAEVGGVGEAPAAVLLHERVDDGQAHP